ncbi:MAG: hypothetical protein IPK82_10310 [Polyangiaceae bacterium]|nr:hypothetical protein [Polyangiaceae bacterium]
MPRISLNETRPCACIALPSVSGRFLWTASAVAKCVHKSNDRYLLFFPGAGAPPPQRPRVTAFEDMILWCTPTSTKAELGAPKR